MLTHETGPMNPQMGGVSISFCGDWVATDHAVPAAASPVLAVSVHVRFDILDQEMKTLMTQIDGVNLAANSLVESGHPRSGEVKQYQDHLNTR